MGILDSLFGKKATLTLQGDDGQSITRTVSEKKLKQWEAEGLIRTLQTVRVHILDPKGSHDADWVIGTDISEELVAKAKDPNSGELYALTVYGAGNPKTSLMPKEHWLKVKIAMGE